MGEGMCMSIGGKLYKRLFARLCVYSMSEAAVLCLAESESETHQPLKYSVIQESGYACVRPWEGEYSMLFWMHVHTFVDLCLRVCADQDKDVCVSEWKL